MSAEITIINIGEIKSIYKQGRPELGIIVIKKGKIENENSPTTPESQEIRWEMAG